MKGFGKLVSVLALGGLVAVGCSKPPSDELTKVEKSFDDARKALVDKYAAKKFKECEKELEKAKSQIETKKYDDARQTLNAIDKKLTDLSTATEEIRDKMKTEAETELPKIEQEIADAKKAHEAEAKKLDEEARKVAQNTFAKVDATLAEIKKSMEAGEYWGLRAKFNSIRSKLGIKSGGEKAKGEKGEKAEKAAKEKKAEPKGDKERTAPDAKPGRKGEAR